MEIPGSEIFIWVIEKQQPKGFKQKFYAITPIVFTSFSKKKFQYIHLLQMGIHFQKQDFLIRGALILSAFQPPRSSFRAHHDIDIALLFQ